MRWITALVDPPIAARVRIAFSKASRELEREAARLIHADLDGFGQRPEVSVSPGLTPASPPRS
jgi:hypothetical protein